jgi:hypothetical protein
VSARGKRSSLACLRAVTVYVPLQMPVGGTVIGPAGTVALELLEEDVERAWSAAATTAECVLDDAVARAGAEATAGDHD